MNVLSLLTQDEMKFSSQDQYPINGNELVNCVFGYNFITRHREFKNSFVAGILTWVQCPRQHIPTSKWIGSSKLQLRYPWRLGCLACNFPVMIRCRVSKTITETNGTSPTKQRVMDSIMKPSVRMATPTHYFP